MQLKNRVSRLFRRGGGLASRKSKSTDFGFLLYLLVKTAFYWLFSHNNRGKKVSRLYWCVDSILVHIKEGNKAGKEKSTKAAFESKQSGNPILLSKNIYRFGCKTEDKCPWLYEGIQKKFRCFGCETQKSVLGYIEGYEKFFEEI